MKCLLTRRLIHVISLLLHNTKIHSHADRTVHPVAAIPLDLRAGTLRRSLHAAGSADLRIHSVNIENHSVQKYRLFYSFSFFALLQHYCSVSINNRFSSIKGFD